ncbi:Peptidase M28 [Enhygromyxa salina]|uniref:Peptidase M28 n=1 Tax=Enhygromyxa salina TaxID=215803 RepID=A0A0C2CZF6_9BACT|nr:M28 family peptidase [Enhygromyxa salina]KIG13227.1 Peptidase M28 [Enhygromyxa salina]
MHRESRRPLTLLTICIALTSLPTACADKPADEAASDTAPTSDSDSDSTDTGTDTEGTACQAETALELAECVERDRYIADLEFIAQPRDPGSAHWQEVQDLCFDRFTEYGFDVELHSYATGVNVIGTKLGTETPEQRILVAGHYDHIPGCNGADDNASGTAATLEAARVLSARDYPRTLVVACWDEEELGLLGAEAYAAEQVIGADGELLFNWNFEMIGFTDDAPDSQTVPDGFELLFPDQVEELEANQYRGDFIAVIVDEDGAAMVQPFMSYAEAFALSAVLLPVPADLKNSPLLADLRRSDHAAFWEIDVPAVMLTDTSEFRYANYHCATGEDAVELLDHDFSAKVISAAVGAAAESLGL